MSNLIILDEVLEKAKTARADENFVLFGERGVVHDSTEKYDFVFHIMRGIPNERFIDHGHLIVPRIGLDGIDGEQKVMEMYRLNKKFPFITTFVSLGNEPQKYRVGKKSAIVDGISVHFYDLFRHSLGNEVCPKMVYIPTSISELGLIVEDSDNFSKRMRQRISTINSLYPGTKLAES